MTTPGDRSFILFVEYDQPGWREPDRWGIGWHNGHETAHFWFGHAFSYTYDRRRDPRPAPRTQRRPLSLIVGRYATQDEAENVRAAAVAVQREIQGRADAVQAEMKEAIAPFRSRLAQLDAEKADVLRIITQTKGPEE